MIRTSLPLRRLTAIACLSLGSCLPPISRPSAIQGVVSLATPCAERLILRNHSSDARTVRLEGDWASPNARFDLRGRKPGGVYASTIRPLPLGGAIGWVLDGKQRLEFDSRGMPPCVGPLPDQPPATLPDDYLSSNALTRRDVPTALYPGLVYVEWRSPLNLVAADSLLRELDASVVGGAPLADRLAYYYLWFDGDDSLGTIASARAQQLRASPLVLSAGPESFHFNLTPR